MKKMLTAFCLAAGMTGHAQDKDCGCAGHFQFVKTYMENNHAGFSDNVPEERRAAYGAFCRDISDSIASDRCHSRCSEFIDRYLKYFDDHHIYIDEPFPFINDKDSATVARFRKSAAFGSTPRMTLGDEALESLRGRKSDDIEGIYYSYPYPDYTLAVVQDGGVYKGIVLSSATPLWDKGQVKFVLTPSEGPAFSARISVRDHSQQTKTVVFHAGTLDGLFLSKNPTAITPSSPFAFRPLNDSVNYIQVISFMGPLYNNLDSFYKIHSREITSCPYLVIDIRDNPGGAEKCYQGLLDFVYTDPIRNDNSEIYVTPDNLRVYRQELDKIRADSAGYGESALADIRKYVAEMQRARPHTYVPMDGDQVTYNRRDTVYAYPRKVVLLYNRNTASSAESLILDAMQSRKVVTAGENSGGYLGYGNVFAVPVPHSDMTLGCTTTRSPNRRQYEKVGIPPQVRFGVNSDWVKEAVGLMRP